MMQGYNVGRGDITTSKAPLMDLMFSDGLEWRSGSDGFRQKSDVMRRDKRDREKCGSKWCGGYYKKPKLWKQQNLNRMILSDEKANFNTMNTIICR